MKRREEGKGRERRIGVTIQGKKREKERSHEQKKNTHTQRQTQTRQHINRKKGRRQQTSTKEVRRWSGGSKEKESAHQWNGCMRDADVSARWEEEKKLREVELVIEGGGKGGTCKVHGEPNMLSVRRHSFLFRCFESPHSSVSLRLFTICCAVS